MTAYAEVTREQRRADGICDIPQVWVEFFYILYIS